MVTIGGSPAREQHGLGNLELLGTDSLLAAWRYTAAQGPAAAHSCAVQHRTGDAAGRKARRRRNRVPLLRRGTQLGRNRVPQLRGHQAAETRSLLRLWRFARPHLATSGWALCLTFAGKAAELAGPYVTMHLIDDVLVPQQDSGGQWDPHVIAARLRAIC